ncbi:MAG: hypothetical protein SGPRY_008046, partial [Prymnesium sp.]
YPPTLLPAGESAPMADGFSGYYASKIEELEVVVRERSMNLRRLEAQRNELNSKVRLLREELSLLQEPGSYVGEVVKIMGRKKVLVKVHPEGKYVVDIGASAALFPAAPLYRSPRRPLLMTAQPNTSSSCPPPPIPSRNPLRSFSWPTNPCHSLARTQMHS